MMFELRDLGALEVRGLPRPVPAYCVLGLVCGNSDRPKGRGPSDHLSLSDGATGANLSLW